MSIHPQIIEKDGIKEFAVIPYQEFIEIQQILEDFEDLQSLREAKSEDYNKPAITLSQLLAEVD
jgi:DNA integrity scanning protein DisA with diadenylate cyclase activity